MNAAVRLGRAPHQALKSRFVSACTPLAGSSTTAASQAEEEIEAVRRSLRESTVAAVMNAGEVERATMRLAEKRSGTASLTKAIRRMRLARATSIDAAVPEARLIDDAEDRALFVTRQLHARRADGLTSPQ